MVAGGSQGGLGDILGIARPTRLHRGDQVVDQFAMEVVSQLQGQPVVAGVLPAGVVVGRQDDDQRLDPAVGDRVVDDVLELVRIFRRPHQGCFVAPTAMTQIQDVVLLGVGVAVGQIDPSRLGDRGRLVLVGEGLVGVVSEFLQPPG